MILQSALKEILVIGKTWASVADKQETVVAFPKPGRGTVDPGFGFRCQAFRGRYSDTSFRVAVQGWRMEFTDRTKVGHTSKVGASLTFPGLFYIMPLTLITQN